MIKNAMELIAVLGQNIEDVQKIGEETESQRDITVMRSQNTAMLAKQFINTCNLVQKEDKMIGKHEATDHLIGYYK